MSTPEGKPPESVRAAVLRHLTVIRERLSKHYRDDALWAAIQSAEEAVLIEPIEAERAAILDELHDLADEYERAGDRKQAHAVLHAAEKVLARMGTGTETEERG